MDVTAPRPSLLGTRIGNYQVVDRIAAGAMGEVYLARHDHLGRHVAIKVIRTAWARDERFVARFLTEAQVAARLKHPHIVDVFDFGHLADGSPYLVMEHLEGATLAFVIRTRGPLPVAFVRHVVAQVGSALTALHARGIVHRDLKPENLLVLADPREPERPLLKVLDFGVAKQVDTGGVTQTAPGELIGTPLYAPPEQHGNPARVDTHADQYALALIAYEMLVAAAPFRAETLGEVLQAHAERSLPPLPEPLQALHPVVARATAKAPDERYASVDEFVRAFDQAATGLAGAGDAAATVILGRGSGPPARQRRGALVLAILAASAVGGGAVVVQARRRPSPAPAKPLAIAPGVPAPDTPPAPRTEVAPAAPARARPRNKPRPRRLPEPVAPAAPRFAPEKI